MEIDNELSLAPAELQNLAAECVRVARAQSGVSAAVGRVSESRALEVGCRRGAIESTSFSRERGISITVYCGQKKGSADASDISPAAIAAVAEKAATIARASATDRFFGLPDKSWLAQSFPALDLYHPESPLAHDPAAALAATCAAEEASWAADARVDRDKSEGATCWASAGRDAFAASDGFCVARQSTLYALSCGAIAVADGEMERDGWDFQARAESDLQPPAAIGREAGLRAARRLGAKPALDGEWPVLFASPASHSLVGHIVGAASGGRLFRKLSFLRDMRGERIAAAVLSAREEPFAPRGLSSAACDDEGVAARVRPIVEQGILRDYFLDCYSARRLGAESTGSANGCHNIVVDGGPQAPTFDEMLGDMRRGFVVTELMGQGANLLNGDYSRGAAGFWVEDGRIVHPVGKATIAGNLRDMLPAIVAVGGDKMTRGAFCCGSILVGKMTVGGG